MMRRLFSYLMVVLTVLWCGLLVPPRLARGDRAR
jgi:hypothetical protein